MVARKLCSQPGYLSSLGMPPTPPPREGSPAAVTGPQTPQGAETGNRVNADSGGSRGGGADAQPDSGRGGQARRPWVRV